MRNRYTTLILLGLVAALGLYFGLKQRQSLSVQRASHATAKGREATVGARSGKTSNHLPEPGFSQGQTGVQSSLKEPNAAARPGFPAGTRTDTISSGKALIDATLVRLQANPHDLAEVRVLLASPEGKVREAAALVLGNVGTSEAISMLLGAIKREQDTSVRENLLECLRGVSNPAAVPVLAEQAKDLTDLALHRVCRNAMSAMSDPSAVAQLIEMLGGGGSDAALEPIAYAVSHMSSTNVLAGLITGAASENDRVAKACIQGLGNLASPEAYLALLETTGTYEGSERGQVAVAVANQTALEKRDSRFIEASVKVISTTTSVQAWQTAVDGLVAIPSAEALAALENQVGRERNTAVVAYLQDAIGRHKRLWPAQVAGTERGQRP